MDQNKSSRLSACGSKTQEYFQKLDSSKNNDSLFYDILRNSQNDCQNQIIVHLAKHLKHLNKDRDYTFFDQTLNAFSEFSHVADSVAREEIRAALTNLVPNSYLAKSYFLALSENHIDLRTLLKGKIKEDWGVTPEGHRDSLTWSYYLYRAHLGDIEAVDILAKKTVYQKTLVKSQAEDRLNVLIELTFLKDSPNLALVDKYFEVINMFMNDTSRISHPGGDPAPGSESISRDTTTPLHESLTLNLFSNMAVNDIKNCPTSLISLLFQSELAKDLKIFQALRTVSAECFNEAASAIAVVIHEGSPKEFKDRFFSLIALRGNLLTERAKIPVKYLYLRLAPQKDNPDYLKGLEQAKINIAH